MYAQSDYVGGPPEVTTAQGNHAEGGAFELGVRVQERYSPSYL
jgi:hypothetical protein